MKQPCNSHRASSHGVSLVSARRWIAVAIGSAALIASESTILLGQSPNTQPSMRSVNDNRVRPVDELDRPRNEERQTHRGYEVRMPQFTVVSMTGRDDARAVAEEVKRTWAFTASLADNWMTEHRRGDFGIGALQVVIDNEPIRDRDQPATTVDVVGLITQVHIRVGTGLPSLEKQLPAMREGVALAILHTAECDKMFPLWATSGLATYVALETGSDNRLPDLAKTPEIERVADVGGYQWRAKRSSQDELEAIAVDRTAAAQMVQFLLEGNDAHRAWDFFDALKAAHQSALPAGERLPEVSILPRERFARHGNELLEKLPAAVAAEFEAWKNEPLARQPIYLVREDASEQQRERELEMVTILKLARQTRTPRDSRMKTKIVEFRKANTLPAASPTTTQPLLTLEALYESLTAENRTRWATVGAHGELLLSTNTAALRDLLGIDDERFEVVSEDGAWKLLTRLDDGRYLLGYLADNRENPARPLARFELRKTREKPEVPAEKQVIQPAEVGTLPLGDDRLLPIAPLLR